MGLLKPRTTTVPIYQGDDLELLAQLHRAAQHAEAAADADLKAAKLAARGTPMRAGDSDPVAEAETAFAAAVKPAQDAYDAAVDDAAERAVWVTLTSIGPIRWRDLLAEHPARTHEVDGKEETIEADQLYGVNSETFPMALLTYSRNGKRIATIDPPVSEADFKEFLEEEVSSGDFEKLWTNAYWLNRSQGADPKDSKFSTASLRSDEN